MRHDHTELPHVSIPFVSPHLYGTVRHDFIADESHDPCEVIGPERRANTPFDDITSRDVYPQIGSIFFGECLKKGERSVEILDSERPYQNLGPVL